MLNQIFENNGVNGTRTREVPLPGRCSLTQQRGSGRRLATARMKWNKEVKKTENDFYKSKLFDQEGTPIMGYRKNIQRMDGKRNV